MFTACGCIFKVITLVSSNQSNYFEYTIEFSKHTLKTSVATQLYSYRTKNRHKYNRRQINPFQISPFQNNPFQIDPFQINPFQTNPFQINPF